MKCRNSELINGLSLFRLNHKSSVKRRRPTQGVSVFMRPSSLLPKYTARGGFWCIYPETEIITDQYGDVDLGVARSRARLLNDSFIISSYLAATSSLLCLSAHHKEANDKMGVENLKREEHSYVCCSIDARQKYPLAPRTAQSSKSKKFSSGLHPAF